MQCGAHALTISGDGVVSSTTEVHHISPRNGEADIQGVSGPHIVNCQCFPSAQFLIPRACPGVGEGVVSGNVGEEADTACESGNWIPHTIPTPHCLPDHQGRVRLEVDGVTGIHSDAPHKAGVRWSDSHYELIHNTHTEGINGNGEGIRRTGEFSHIQESIGGRFTPCQHSHCTVHHISQ